MRTSRANRKPQLATGVRRVSLDLTSEQDYLDRKMLEAIQRIERLRSMALGAIGTMLQNEQ